MKKFTRSITLVSDYRSRAVGLACLVWASSIVAAGAFWPFTATEENPFAGKSFITDWKHVHTGFTSLRAYVFDTDTGVTIGHLHISFAEGRSKGMIDEGLSSQPYEVDYKKKKIRFPRLFKEYSYQAKGKVITIKSATETINLYEVDQPAFFLPGADSDPERLAKYHEYWDILRNRGLSFDDAPGNRGVDRVNAVEAVEEKNTTAIRNYLDNLIVKAKGTPPVPLPPVDPDPPVPTPTPSSTPTPSPPPLVPAIASSSSMAVAPEPSPITEDADEDKKEELRRPTDEELVDGKYDGALVSEITGANDKIEIRIESKSEPSSGTPPTAPIKVSTALPELGRGDEELWGVATYGTPTTVSFGWKNQTGTAKFDGQLEGDKLSGTWSVEGANGEAGRGTFEAIKSKL